MSTEVKDGSHPRFTATRTGGHFGAMLEGYYTDTPGLGAGGVAAHRYESDRPAKRRNELLVLRTVFLEWFLEQWREQGGQRARAIAAIREYPLEKAWPE